MTTMTNALATPKFASERTLVALLFFVACPVMIGFPMGWYQAGLGRYLPVAASCGLWVSQWLISWWLSELLLRGGRAVLKPWDLPLTALLVLAAVGNILLSRFWGPAINSLFLTLSGIEDQSMIGTNRSLLDIVYVGRLFRASAYGAVYWCVLRYFYERYRTRDDRAGDASETPYPRFRRPRWHRLPKRSPAGPHASRPSSKRAASAIPTG